MIYTYRYADIIKAKTVFSCYIYHERSEREHVYSNGGAVIGDSLMAAAACRYIKKGDKCIVFECEQLTRGPIGAV